MEQFLSNLVTDAGNLGPMFSYAVVGGILLLSGFGLPIPEDIPLITAGVLCYNEMADLPTMLVLTFIFVVGADLMLFCLGRQYGHHVPRLPLVRHYLTPARILRAEKYFVDHGGKTLFIGRVLPGLRAPIFFSAGVCRIPAWKMIVYDGSAAILSVPALVLLGYFGAEQIDKFRRWAAFGEWGIVVLIVLGVACLVGWKVWRRRRAGGPEPVAQLAVKQPQMEEAIRRSA